MTEKKQELTEERVREIVREEWLTMLRLRLGEEEWRRLGLGDLGHLGVLTAPLDSDTRSDTLQ